MRPISETVDYITGKELDNRLRRGEEIVLIDARSQNGYAASNIRPRASMRIAPGSTDGDIERLPRDKLLVAT
jgi:hypothetical protein